MQQFHIPGILWFSLFGSFALSLSLKPNCTAPDKVWSSWKSWIVCSQSCGMDGVRFRYRYCKQKNQKECIHAIGTQREYCNRYKCPNSSNDYYDMSERDLSLCLFYNPTNGGWSEWKPVSRCTALACIGISIRYCDNPAPMYCGHHCKGGNIRMAKCSIDYKIHSEGCDDPGAVDCGSTSIIVDNKDYSERGRGMNFATFDTKTGKHISSASFDSHGNKSACEKSYQWISSLKEDVIVLAGIQDEATRYLNNYCIQALLLIGGNEPFQKEFRGSFALAGYKGKRNDIQWIQQKKRPPGKGPTVLNGNIKLVEVTYFNL